MLAIADTWAHRMLAWRPSSGGLRPLPEPADGWYGPRGAAVAADGRLAIAEITAWLFGPNADHGIVELVRREQLELRCRPADER